MVSPPSPFGRPAAGLLPQLHRSACTHFYVEQRPFCWTLVPQYLSQICCNKVLIYYPGLLITSQVSCLAEFCMPGDGCWRWQVVGRQKSISCVGFFEFSFSAARGLTLSNNALFISFSLQIQRVIQTNEHLVTCKTSTSQKRRLERET